MQPSIRKNLLYRAFYEILLIITPFITTPYVSRVLGADGVGDYSYTHSVITYFMLFGALGTAGYGAREISRARDDKNESSKLFWEIELMTVFTTGICLIIWVGVIAISRVHRWYYIALTPFLLSTMFDISWYFTGLEKVKNIVVRNSLVRVLSIALLFLLVRKKEDILAYCALNSIAAFFGSLSMWLYLPGMLAPVKLKSLSFKRHFHETLIYFIPTIATSIYTVLDKTLIGVITENSYQNGYYEQATKIINICKALVFAAVNSVMGARISYLFAENRFEEIRNRIHKSMDFIYFLAYGAGFGIVGIANRFVPTFFGRGYEQVEVLLYCMAPLILIIGTSNCLGSQYYTPSGQRKRSAKIIVLGALLNLLLNLVLIPGFAAYGATIASVIAEVVITILYVKNCDGYITWSLLGHYSLRRIIAGIMMCFLVIWIGKLNTMNNVYIVGTQVVVGCIAYVLLLLLLKDPIVRELAHFSMQAIHKK